jgi:uncharacterized alkaline shock family protein YloU
MTETGASVRIAPEVLATIVRMTTMSIPGIVAMADLPHGHFPRKRLPDATRGVHAEVRDMTVRADVYVVVAHGANLVSVGNAVQRAVGEAVREMLGMSVRNVNVFVQGIE